MIIALVHLIFIIIYYFYSNGNSKMWTEKWVVPENFLPGMIINERFKVGDSLGGGYTGFVRSGIDMETEKPVAIKFAKEELFSSLEKEYKNYVVLGAKNAEIIKHGIPQILYFGNFAGYKVLVMTKVGPPLYQLQSETRFGKFGMKTISKIAIQGIRILEYIHSKGLLFHDVKTANMAIGDGEEHENQIFFYDFAFSERYLDGMGKPKRRKEVDDMNGTPDYFAIEPLRGQTHVRKDELFSFGVCLMDLNKADLPWIEKTKDVTDIFKQMDIVLNEWEKLGIEAICNSTDNPKLFLKYFNYLDSMKVAHGKPDYDLLTELFASQLTEKELKDPNLGIFDDPDKTELEAQFLGKIIAGRFEIRDYLRNEFAAFVLNGIDLETNTEVIIKFGSNDESSWLEKEYKNLLLLGADDTKIIRYGIPHITYFGSFEKYNVMVMSKIGPTLHDLWRDANRKLEIDAVCKIAIKAIRTFEYIHSKGLILCDIKPQNFGIGHENPDEIFILSFVFGQSYANAFDSNKQRLKAKYIQGTPEYMSIEALNKLKPVQKDDLISLGIVLMELNGAHIPWANKATAENNVFKRMDIILQEWENHPIKEVCNGTDNPKLFKMYFEYLNDIPFYEKPNYDQLVGLFTEEPFHLD